MSSILAFDTLEYSKALQDAGMDRTLAELIARKQREAFEEVLDARQLVTKQDLQLEIEKVRSDLTQSIEKVRADLTLDMEKLRGEFRTEIEKTRAEIEKSRAEAAKMNHSMLKWMIGIWASMGLGLLLAMAKGFHWLGM